MDETMKFPAPRGGSDTTLAAVNEQLARSGLPVTREDALMLAERRADSLASIERVEFGAPVGIGTPYLLMNSLSVHARSFGGAAFPQALRTTSLARMVAKRV